MVALSTVSTGGTTYDQVTINQLVQELQPASGGQEVGNFYIQGNAYVASTSLFLSDCVCTLARGATPVSISISAGTPSNLSAPRTGHLKSGSVQIYAQGGTKNIDCKVSGSYTIFF